MDRKKIKVLLTSTRELLGGTASSIGRGTGVKPHIPPQKYDHQYEIQKRAHSRAFSEGLRKQNRWWNKLSRVAGGQLHRKENHLAKP